MELVLTIFYQLIALISMTGVGWLLTKTGRMKDGGPLNGLLLNAALPAMIINALQISASRELLIRMGVTLAGMMALVGVGCAAGFLIAAAFRQKESSRGVWISCIAFPNSVFMGQPLMTALYGEEALPLSASIMLVFNLASYIIMSKLYAPKQTGRSISVKKLLLQPVAFSCFVAVALHFMPFRLPGTVQGALRMLAALTTPLSMIIIGHQLAKEKLRQILLDRDVYILALSRLVPAACAVHLVLRIFIRDPVILGILTISACMPTAAVVSVFATEMKSDALLCSKAIFLSTMLCVFTAPVLLGLMLR